MNRSIEGTGRTVEEATQNCLAELNVDKDKVDVEVLEQGSRGLFGRLGTKPARVRVTVRDDYVYETRTFLRSVLDSMGIKAEIHIEDDGDMLRVNLVGPDMGILIGHRGETLDSLQYLTSLVINRENGSGEYKRVILDTENYRKKREETLIRLAHRLASNARSSGRRVMLEPMNPYERRIIHSALQDDPYVTTYSEGEEPYRKVVIELKR